MVRGPIRRWRGYGKPQRAELYFRWSLYLVAWIMLPVALLATASSVKVQGATTAAQVGLALSLASVLVTLRAYRTSLDHYLGRPSTYRRWLIVSAVLTVAGSWTLLLLGPASDGVPPHPGPPFTSVIAAALVGATAGPTGVGLRWRWAFLSGTALVLLIAPAMLLAGAGFATTSGWLIGAVVGTVLMVASCRSFAWVTAVVWELDAAREAQSRLAVAEERLRFSRDLHDVMGRNLTTIALKSELAVQLARRGRPEAAEQMAEVQRIAQESQREVRDVIRGYRTADLHAEAIGARAVLRAADIHCDIDLGEEPDRLPPQVQSVLGWVIRESTTNVLRHSEAGRCLIRLRQEDGRVVLELENDGVPAVPLPSQGGGTGLHGLRERLAVHDGELTVPTTAPGTFRMLATVPLPG
ncbi:sensor histidine kinase [Kitasatospora aureofaciens]|uniref:sensor histidine kinase n=1 Tax=Kitasatospora aureofaciens TaxID=1894 RepID=UPI001D986E3B|nr:sensor histidine kinase [Kitasatospora aureofaciens]HJD81416.1 sensor histidine kinase [Kitasatospora aureofaciens]